ncbi:MBL fold metallo-hydrolase [Cohaesibacter celericrescens]|uniref:MBL fold metallo-hydrolase n=1 Tax=Cohaesibacter celericrescens TaxID=2067669 RepID=A0A2N5XXG0_9HYPH|nr:MBL fold metallo-hydrolase [Cohaesibacter celericrescens]PLW79135.1 MBL fold metallo-hydrolase [Cohaesibacter celericrescens]
MKVAIIPVTPFQQNCTLIWDEETGKGVVIDPGGDVPQILEVLEHEKIDVERILITHGHIDHVGGAAELRDALDVDVEGPHEADRMLMERVAEQAIQFGLPAAKGCEPDRWLEEGDTVDIAGMEFDVLHCPGHAPGHVVFVNQEAKFAILGDVLFNGSIGRTDLPGGDHATLLASIKNKILPLGDDVSFLCGHGDHSTIGEERRNNPFLKGL